MNRLLFSLLFTLLLPTAAVAQITSSPQTVNGPFVVQGNAYVNGGGLCVNPLGSTGGNAGGICLNALNSQITSGGNLGFPIAGTLGLTLGTTGGATLGSPTGGMPSVGVLNAQGLEINGVAVGSTAAQAINPVTYGAACNGTTNDSAAFQSALTAAGAAGGETVTPPWSKCLLTATVNVPANTTLNCESASPPDAGNSTAYGSYPAIILGSSASIVLSGPGAGIKNCLLYLQGAVFGASSPSAFAGTAIKTVNAAYGSSVSNVTALQFTTCFDNSAGAGRLIVEKFRCDATGTAGSPGTGAIQSGSPSGGNGDINIWRDVEIGPYSTGTGGFAGGSCTAELRPGVGMAFQNTTSDVLDNVTVEDFQQADIQITNSAALKGTAVWTDFDPACSRVSSVGFLVNGGSDIHIGTLDLNGTNEGLSLEGNSSSASVAFSDVQVSNIAQDCLVLGATGSGAGRVSIGSFRANGGATTNCGRYAISFADTVNRTQLNIGYAFLTGVNSGSAPWITDIQSVVTPNLGTTGNINISNLSTTLTAGVNPFGAAGGDNAFKATSYSEPLMSVTVPTIGTCTGLGTGGSCALAPASNTTDGAITLTTGSASTGTSGVAPITLPFAVASGAFCTWTPGFGATAFPQGTTVLNVSVSPTVVEAQWEASSALATGTTYNISYHCSLH